MPLAHRPDPVRAFREFNTESGGATVEFVIILPMLIGFLSLIASASLHFATSADVQQLAHELARTSLHLVAEGDWCEQLRRDYLLAYVENLPTLSMGRISEVACEMPDQIARVSVSYDLGNSWINSFGRLVGLTVEGYTRHGFVQI